MNTVYQTESFKQANIAAQNNGQAYDHTRMYHVMPRMQKSHVSTWTVAINVVFYVAVILGVAYATVPAFRQVVNSLIVGA